MIKVHLPPKYLFILASAITAISPDQPVCIYVEESQQPGEGDQRDTTTDPTNGRYAIKTTMI